MFYQHITDEVFEKLIQHSVSLEGTDTQQCEEHDILLTYEEENAVTYVAGYVICSLLQQKDPQNFGRVCQQGQNRSRKYCRRVVQGY